MLVCLSCVRHSLLQIVAYQIQFLSLLECQGFSLTHHSLDCYYFLVDLRQRFSLLPQQPTLNVEVEPLYLLLLLMLVIRRGLLHILASTVKILGYSSPFLLELSLYHHNFFGCFRTQIRILASTQHSLYLGSSTLLLLE